MYEYIAQLLLEDLSNAIDGNTSHKVGIETVPVENGISVEFSIFPDDGECSSLVAVLFDYNATFKEDVRRRCSDGDVELWVKDWVASKNFYGEPIPDKRVIAKNLTEFITTLKEISDIVDKMDFSEHCGFMWLENNDLDLMQTDSDTGYTFLLENKNPFPMMLIFPWNKEIRIEANSLTGFTEEQGRELDALLTANFSTRPDLYGRSFGNSLRLFIIDQLRHGKSFDSIRNFLLSKNDTDLIRILDTFISEIKPCTASDLSEDTLNDLLKKRL